ncbi:hypothetical protein ACFQ4A_07045, partial [Lentibacillus salinarum]
MLYYVFSNDCDEKHNTTHKICCQHLFKRPPAKAGGFGHKCRRLKSLLQAEVLLKVLKLKHILNMTEL